MNKTEDRYAWELLVGQRQGQILDFQFERMVFRLTTPTRGVKVVSYTPDFCVVLLDGSIRFDEVKGPFIREDADLNFKMAADLFPWFGWRMIQFTGRGVKIIRDIPRRTTRRIGGRLPETDRGTVETQKGKVQGSDRDQLRRDRSKGHQKNLPQDIGGNPD